MVKLCAQVKLRYAKRSLVKGDEFEASEKDGKVLVALGKAVYPTVAKAKYQTREMTAASDTVAPATVTPTTPVVPAPVAREVAPKTLTLPRKSNGDKSLA